MPKKDNPLVSVIIPCYNLGEYLDDAIKSIQSQQYGNWELIIVDDGSTDKKTQHVLERVKANNPDFQVITQKNAGPSAARNHGIEKAQGTYIVCLDADDELAPDYLQKTVDLIEADKTKKVAFVTTWLREFGERDNLWETSDFDVLKLLMTNVIHVASLFRKDIWAEVGGYREGRGVQGYEDWDFWLKIAEKNYRWDIIKEPLFHYRIRKNSLLSTATSVHMEKFGLLLDFHSDLYKKYAKDLILENAKEFRSLHDAVREKNQAINEYLKAVDFYKGQATAFENELTSLYRSRITQIALRLIKFSIYLRKGIPKLKTKLSRRIRALIPSFVKRALRKVKRLLFPITIIKVQNEEWPANKPLVSIVTPFYNSAATITETVSSVLHQTYQSFEYIIIDDGSEESQSKILDEIKDPRIQIIRHKENIGQGSPAAARNEGISLAQGKYIVCLDADDILDPTYLEKGLVLLETHPAISLVTTHQQMFGVVEELFKKAEYDSRHLIKDNMVITAAMFRKEAWEAVGGYKTDIGYEDWEFWLELAEQGYWGKLVPEPLFKYRTATQSRYVDDKKKHDDNMYRIASLHPNYQHVIKQKLRAQKRQQVIADLDTAFINLNESKNYQTIPGEKNILIAVPWMTFGGAETLILNFCKEVKDNFNISFITGLQSEHEWEYKFKEISNSIYHLANLFEDKSLYLEFISNYITTRDIDILHIIHTDFMYDLLPALKERHPGLKIILTMFNDRVEHFSKSFAFEDYIDRFSSDNEKVRDSFKARLKTEKPVTVIANGINCYDTFNPRLYDRASERANLNIGETDLAVFFIGRLSPEKNPNVFVEVATIVNRAREESKHVKFFVIGDGPMRPEIEKMVADNKDAEIVYLGYQSEVAKYLSASDIFVLPSSIEGFPLSVLEAMAMSSVVIASDVGAVSQVVEHGKEGFIITPGSAEEAAEYINKLNQDRDLLASVKRNAREKVEKTYSNVILGENYKNMYEDLLK